MIIIEGADNTGKSTLGKFLSKEFSLELIHSERPHWSWTEEQSLEHSRKQLLPQLAILDRVYALSEYVYGPICRGGSALGTRHAEALVDLYNRPYVIIYCRPQMSTILRNGERDQMEGVVENHQAIVEAYDKLMDEVARFGVCKIIRFDWEELGEDSRLVDKLKLHLKEFHSGYYSSVFMGQGV